MLRVKKIDCGGYTMFILFEEGKINTPVRLLDRGHAITLLKELKEEMEKE